MGMPMGDKVWLLQREAREASVCMHWMCDRGRCCSGSVSMWQGWQVAGGTAALLTNLRVPPVQHVAQLHQHGVATDPRLGLRVGGGDDARQLQCLQGLDTVAMQVADCSRGRWGAVRSALHIPVQLERCGSVCAVM